ncbi:MAG: carotenoid 1,2-hydratase [Burkholderiales bacterium]|nr:carotenoid 1,2-hydratase [Burkholderiales bacterium]
MAAWTAPTASTGYADVTGQALSFPRDFGAHPNYRTEWWYVTGWLSTPDNKPLGFQVTFFRSRLAIDAANPSAFAPKQLVFAHAALADPTKGRLLHDQRVARAGFGLAEVKEGDTDASIGDWRLARGSDDHYRAHIRGSDFSFQLTFVPTQPVLLQGERGYSRKGPRPAQASYYYSRPQLAASGSIERDGKQQPVTGTAWLDHEWSSEYLAADAVGWDWTGVNLNDGGALMLFRIRGKNGEPVWAGGTWRRQDGTMVTFAPDAIGFTALRRWRSPRTNTEYPVAMRVKAGDLVLDLQPLMDDQELDSRASTGTVYWEGAVEVKQAGLPVGRGYLELTGYSKPLKL